MPSVQRCTAKNAAYASPCSPAYKERTTAIGRQLEALKCNSYAQQRYEMHQRHSQKAHAGVRLPRWHKPWATNDAFLLTNNHETHWTQGPWLGSERRACPVFVVRMVPIDSMQVTRTAPPAQQRHQTRAQRSRWCAESTRAAQAGRQGGRGNDPQRNKDYHTRQLERGASIVPDCSQPHARSSTTARSRPPISGLLLLPRPKSALLHANLPRCSLPPRGRFAAPPPDSIGLFLLTITA